MQPTDRVTEALLEALREAVATPGEHRLFRAGKLDGLFAGRTGVAIVAAERALNEGLLQRVRVETKGKTEIEWVAITPAGVEFLHESESPIVVLHQLRDTLRANQQAIPLWLEEMRTTLRSTEQRLADDANRWLEQLKSLDRRVSESLRRLEAVSPLLPAEVTRDHPWAIDALNYLDRRRTAGATEPCPLPELFEAVVAHHPALTLSAFHEGLRQLHRRKALLLREAPPERWTHPEYALFDGTMVYFLAER